MTPTGEEETLPRGGVTWKQVVESVPEQLLLLDLQGNILLASGGLPGGKLHEALGQPFHDQLPPEFREPARRSLERVQGTGEIAAYETRHTTQAGEIRFLETRIGPLRQSGEIVAFVGTTRDVTEHHRLDEEERESDRLVFLSSLVAGLAHGVRNPLFGISATLDAFEIRLTKQEGFERYMDSLRAQVDRLSELMRQMSELGRPKQGNLEPGPLEPVIQEAVLTCRPLAQEHGVELEVSVASGLPAVARSSRLPEAFANVIANAIRRSAEGGTVKVEVVEVQAAEGRRIDCAVRDSGPGFPPADLSRVFEPFCEKRSGETGLGLAIAKKIAREHGGSVLARNLPGDGVVLSVCLPTAGSSAGRSSG
jgi:PAS domain S-box-containing protein